ncbi:unnamed protein product [Parajaminaea phylloscopi]
MAAPLQSISVPRHEQRSSPAPVHVVYAILVSLPVRNWTVYRRYSEFVELHTSLTGLDGPASVPPAPLPPKHVAKSTLRGLRTLGGLLPVSESVREDGDEMLRQRRAGLEAYLRAIVASPQALWRESQAFRDFIELPSTTSSRALVSGTDNTASSAAGHSSSRSGPSSRYVPGSYHPATETPHRQLGASQPAAAAQETATTRGQDDTELFASQQAQFDRQDAALGDLTAILRRQKQMGMAINQELLEQNELLDTLDGEVRETQDKLKKGEAQMKKLR